jgi:DNA-binding NtrC family response regulator
MIFASYRKQISLSITYRRFTRQVAFLRDSPALESLRRLKGYSMHSVYQENNPSLESALKVVAIDDDEQHLKFVATLLAQDNVVVFTSTDSQAGLRLVETERPHLVIVDLVMPGLSGMELLERIVEFDPATEIVLLTGHYSAESAVEAIQKGACDYLTKPVQAEKLQERVESLLTELRNRQRRLELENALLDTYQFAAMVGRSAPMLETFRRIRRIAQHFRTVLITGETGTGKELAARALHDLSPAAAGPFIACNCSALVETLAESELFGHVKGAFTGATQDRAGIFEAANGGTVLLDEVGELSPAAQAKLLRVLQNQEIQRVGSPTVRRVEVRVIAATHRDLRAMIAEHRFREDLFYRLSMVHVTLPSLAERKEDLPLLQQHFVKRFAQQYGKPVRGITRRAQALLSRYPWPGNIRELENVLGNACMMTEGETVDIGDLPDYIRSREPSTMAHDGAVRTLAEVEKAHVLHVLETLQGNKARAAELLGISRAKLYRVLADSDLEDSSSN